MFRGDVQHRGIYEAAGVPKFSEVKWSFHTGGMVYFMAYDGNLYALDSASGLMKWKYQTGGERRFAAKHLWSAARERDDAGPV